MYFPYPIFLNLVKNISSLEFNFDGYTPFYPYCHSDEGGIYLID